MLFTLLAVPLVTGCENYPEHGIDSYRPVDNPIRGARIQKADEIQRFNTYKQDPSIRVANDAKERIEQLNEIESAIVIISNKNAYIAVVFDEELREGLGKDLEQKIIVEVMSTSDMLSNVYISDNQELIIRMKEYSEMLRNGKPLTDTAEEFNQTMERFFPIA